MIKALAAQLEWLVDHHGMSAVLEALARTASAKSDHLATNWGDTAAAADWEMVAGILRAISARHFCNFS
jgi:hypothetical protein